MLSGGSPFLGQARDRRKEQEMSASVHPPAAPPPPRPAAVPGGDAGASRDPGDGQSRLRLLLAVGAVAVVGMAVLLVAVVGSGKKDEQAAPAVATVGAQPADHSVAAAVAGRQKAQLEIVSGAESIVVRSAAIGDDLYQASTPVGGSLVPKATVNGDTVQLSLVSLGTVGAATAEVVLNSAVTWQLKLAGGGMKETIDFSSGKLSGIEFAAGANELEVTLPPAQGTVLVKLAGGAGQLKVHAAQGLPVQVKVGGAGAGVLTVDGQTRNAVKGGTEVTPVNWAKATDRYTVEATVGLSTLIVDHR